MKELERMDWENVKTKAQDQMDEAGRVFLINKNIIKMAQEHIDGKEM